METNETIKAITMPSDKVTVVNDSPEKSHIGEGNTIIEFSGDDYRMKFSVEFRGEQIEGVSEKQIDYAWDIRNKAISSVWEMLQRKRDTIMNKLGDKYAEKIKSEMADRGIKTYSEFLAHTLAGNSKIEKLLKLKSAREILDKYR